MLKLDKIVQNYLPRVLETLAKLRKVVNSRSNLKVLETLAKLRKVVNWSILILLFFEDRPLLRVLITLVKLRKVVNWSIFFPRKIYFLAVHFLFSETIVPPLITQKLRTGGTILLEKIFFT